MSPHYAPEKSVSLVYDAVYSYAYALENIVKHLDCGIHASNREEYLSCLKDHLPLYMRNVTFLGETERVRYIPMFGYTKRHYVINNLQNTSNGYELVKIGVWNKTSTALEMDDVDIHWAPHYKGEKPTSFCSKPCGIGEEMVHQQRRCCWSCQQCQEHQITFWMGPVKRCESCKEGQWPDQATRTKCQPRGNNSVKPRASWGYHGFLSICLFAVCYFLK